MARPHWRRSRQKVAVDFCYQHGRCLPLSSTIRQNYSHSGPQLVDLFLARHPNYANATVQRVRNNNTTIMVLGKVCGSVFCGWQAEHLARTDTARGGS